MNSPSKPDGDPTTRRTTLVDFVATSAVARSATHRCGGRRADGCALGAVPGSRSDESGGLPGVAGREAARVP